MPSHGTASAGTTDDESLDSDTTSLANPVLPEAAAHMTMLVRTNMVSFTQIEHRPAFGYLHRDRDGLSPTLLVPISERCRVENITRDVCIAGEYGLLFARFGVMRSDANESI